MLADLSADSVYFLMFDGWAREMRSNRWHYASRWARHLPVVLVQPVLTKDEEPSVSVLEPRIPNTRILKIRAGDPPLGALTTGVLQAKQLYDDMRAHGYARPIFWTYNPDYLFASEMLPAAIRVFHATENYFYFASVSEGFIDRLKRLLAISDLVIGVSEGVVASHRPFAKGVAHTVTNGCDFRFYDRRGRDEAVAQLGEGWKKTVVYAGNINGRLDFELLDAVAKAVPDTIFVFFGPVSAIAGTADAVRWEKLIALSNVSYQGAADVERLPAIFATAHVGLIPYKSDPILVDNTFPLKAFEMQSAGLPVVSTYFDALKDEAGPGLRIAQDAAVFIGVVEQLDRRLLSDRDQAAMKRQCLSHDYDGKFDTVLNLVAAHLAQNPGVTAPALELRGLASLIKNPDLLARLYTQGAPGQIGFRTLLAKRLSGIAEATMNGIRLALPKPVKNALKKIVTTSQ